MPAGPLPDNWAQATREANRRLYSELDVLLKALVRYFDPANHQNQPDKDYARELGVVRDALLKALSILDQIIPETSRNAYWFQKFAEERLMAGAGGNSFRRWMYAQGSVEQALYLLYDSLINMKSIAGEILRGGAASWASFSGIGQLAGREIMANRHFNPFATEITPEFDGIRNPGITAIVRSVGQREEKKTISAVFLSLFRYLRYLGHVDLASGKTVSLHSGYIILLLLRPELNAFSNRLERLSAKTADRDLAGRLESASYQLSMEERRVFGQELKDFLGRTASRQKGKLENGHGILKNLLEQVTLMLGQHWRPELKGEDVFESFVTRVEQSARLRDDVAILHRLLALMDKKAGSGREMKLIQGALRNFMEYFESFTFRLLRYDDYEEFAAFFSEMQKLLRKGELEKLLEKSAHFRIYLEATLGHIGNRAELRERPFSRRKIDEVIRQYLTG